MKRNMAWFEAMLILIIELIKRTIINIDIKINYRYVEIKQEKSKIIILMKYHVDEAIFF